MSNDPFSEFSKIFAGEFGRALSSAWQETMSKSFANAFGQMPFSGVTGAKPENAANNPFAFYQQFMNAFPGADRSGLGGGADYLQFGEFFKPYLEKFSAGIDPLELSQQMASAFRKTIEQAADLNQSWPTMFQQLGHLNGLSDFVGTASKVFTNQAEAFAAAPFGAMSGDFGVGEFTPGKTPAALGPAREWQIALNEVVKAGDRLRAAQARMQEHTSATFEEAAERFWRDLGRGEDELSSLKEVYDYWVNCAEAAYYERVMSDEYSADFGEAINSQADFKVKLTAIIDRFLEMLNVPNRRELNGIIRQLASIESRLEAMEKLDGSTKSSADKEVKALKKEIQDLRAELLAQGDSAKRKTPKEKVEKKSVANSDSTKPKKSKKKKTASKPSKSKKHADFDITNITDSD